MNTLYYGDNLKILREYMKDETVDLVYLDPPFNSNRNYNVLFKDESGVEADSQITAFEDTWHWNASAERTYLEHEASEVRPAASESETDSPRAGRLPAFQYRIIGEPEDLDGARQLASEDRYQFQWWALSLIKARPLGGAAGSKEGKKGSDKGIDGTMVFTDIDERTGVSALRAKRVIVQVKSGHVKSGDIR